MREISTQHDYLYNISRQYLNEFLGKKVFLTGMTGFFGLPFLEFLFRCKDENNDNSRVYILTRNESKFKKNNPILSDKDYVYFIEGDVRSFLYPTDKIDYVIHGASVSSKEKFDGCSPLERYDRLNSGTRYVLDFSVYSKASKFLLISSGSVYGNVTNFSRISENCLNAPDVINDIESCYSEGKRSAELLCAIYSRSCDMEVVIARCFAFIGPNIPLDINYAIGNFISNSINGKKIEIKGNGTPIRSYLYTYDLAVWLSCLLVNGENRSVYNVGSDEFYSISSLAKTIKKELNDNVDILFLNKNNELIKKTSASNMYVPNISKAKNNFGLSVYTGLNKAVYLTAKSLS
jgi:nucleoside-diphosphate-sugar epimerase